MITKDYKKVTNLIKMSLEQLYNDPSSYALVDKNLINIVQTEAPLTLNTLKARFREIFNVAKISGKALDIIMERVAKLGIIYNEELYDFVIWPASGEFSVNYLRINSDRLIYDIPPVELKNLVKELNLSGEELYREILKYFNLEVLTEKARNYLEFVEKY